MGLADQHDCAGYLLAVFEPFRWRSDMDCLQS
jgi:hypothetical protein